MRLRSLLIPLLLAFGLLATAGACGTSANHVEMGPDVTVVDVRTPEEFAMGHLDGAVNISLTSGNFEQEIQSLDPTGKYIIYCRTGNRSAQAVDIMTDLGFENLHDAGSMEDGAQYTGLDIVMP